MQRSEASAGESKARTRVLFCDQVHLNRVSVFLRISPFAFVFIQVLLDSVLKLPCLLDKEKLPNPLQGEEGQSPQPGETSWLRGSLAHSLWAGHNGSYCPIGGNSEPLAE